MAAGIIYSITFFLCLILILFFSIKKATSCLICCMAWKIFKLIIPISS